MILVAMIGVGVAEEAERIAALIRKMVQVAPASAITFIIVLLGGVSSVASDAGYLVLIPLGAAAFVSLGRHPLAGIAAAYAGVSASFSRWGRARGPRAQRHAQPVLRHRLGALHRDRHDGAHREVRRAQTAGMGTVVSMMLPYTVVLLVTWTLFFVIWYPTGIPWGLGAPVELPGG
ncbi:hypothetical protein GCM10023153_05780 [Ornithinibacter aureus]|uniref:Uncharacterized protein n=1 Tax=Ornithinibacter aureus TaxID=622664 RepID=A0ABP8JEU4_9MICO